jgi:probable F420-dependent oxidoreductase
MGPMTGGVTVLKVRIGIGIGAVRPEPGFAGVIDLLEENGVDSVWLSERVHAPAVDPWVGLSFAAARTRRLKLGTGVSVLPGRNPVLVAKQVASLRELAPGRVLPAFGLQPAVERERAYYPIPDRRRGAVFDESLTVVRGLLENAEFSFDGEYFQLDRASTGFAPHGLDLWLGGSGPLALSRLGRLADGWLASFISPAEAEAGRSVIEAAAAEVNRSIDDDHYGMNIFLAQDGAAALMAARRRPDLDPRLLVAESWGDTRRLIQDFVAAGVSKFVVHSAPEPDSWPDFLARFAAEPGPLQH